MNAITAHGHHCTIILYQDTISLVRLISGGRTEKTIPIRDILGVDVHAPSLLRRGRLALHLAPGGLNTTDACETLVFERAQRADIHALETALRSVVSASRA